MTCLLLTRGPRNLGWVFDMHHHQPPTHTTTVVSALLLGCLSLPAPAASLDELVARAPDGADIGIAAYHCADERWAYRYGAERELRLASVTKLAVAAAALLELGPDYTFRTRILALEPIVDGRAHALAVIGGGSPCLDEHFTDGDPDAIPRRWAQELQRAGITGSGGDLLIDSSIFDDSWRPATYPDDHRNAQQWYSAPASGFAFNDNCIDLQVVPAAAGARATVITRPRSPRIEIINRSRSVAGKGDGRLNVWRHHHANTLVVSGKYGEPSAWFTLSIRDDPDLLAGDHLRWVWGRHGVDIDGTVRRATVDPDAGRLVVDHRDPLLPALRILNQRSQNFYGEQILRLLGHQRSGQGSTAAGARAVRDILAAHLDLHTGLHPIDGSGLSYENRGSAEAVCRLLDRMLESPHREAWLSTFKERQVGDTTILAKTGTLAVARCLAGYVPTPEGGWMAFAVLLNRGESRSIGWARDLRRDFARALVENASKP